MHKVRTFDKVREFRGGICRRPCTLCTADKRAGKFRGDTDFGFAKHLKVHNKWLATIQWKIKQPTKMEDDDVSV